MRSNKFGVRGIKARVLRGHFVYDWTPPVSLRKTGILHQVALGPDLETAKTKARQLNVKLAEYRANRFGLTPKLTIVKSNTAAALARMFETSPKFARYSLRCRQDYRWTYRRIEAFEFDGRRRFGDLNIRQVTRQIAYRLYEHYVGTSGFEAANKMMCAWQAAFKYATLRIPGIVTNPFSQLGKQSSPPRRQRWTNRQLTEFIAKADEMGYASIGRCALMCMELVQRPGDVLSLTWESYNSRRGAICILQSKRGVELWVPPTQKLRVALQRARREQELSARGKNIDECYICSTKTGKKWHRRNFTKTVRYIARAAGIPDDLQIRDLRRTAATEGAAAGATPWEMMAAGGWQHQACIRPYFVHTQQQAAAFQAKREAYRRRHREK